MQTQLQYDRTSVIQVYLLSDTYQYIRVKSSDRQEGSLSQPGNIDRMKVELRDKLKSETSRRMPWREEMTKKE